MSKKLKFRNLTTMKTKINDITASISPSTSQYFSDDAKEAKRVKTEVKKHSPVKVQYEEMPKIKKEIKKSPRTELKKRLPIKVEYEEVSQIKREIEESPKTELKKRLPIKVEKSPKTELKKRLPIKVEYEEVSQIKREIEESPNTDHSNSTKSSEQWEPKDWQLMLSNIQEMRKGRTAPVDEMGCHKCSDPNAAASVSRFQALVALMLSSQTKDRVTFAAMERLKNHGCTPANIKCTPDDTLGKLIYPVGFWRRKVGYIKKTAEILLEQYAGDIPKTIDGLCKLPGVGPKMGHICMQVAWGEVSGIGVDTHVHRISNRLGWVQKPTKTPEQTRRQLELWLPGEKWIDINHILVGFGQEICLPLRPKCTGCLNKNICPYGKTNRAS